MNSTFQPKAFTVIKFEPSDIILQHNINRKFYSYHQIQLVQCSEPTNQLILKAEPLCGGFVSEKQLTHLGKCIQPKIEARAKIYYEQAELENTFQGILHYIQSGQKYGNLDLQNILIDNEGAIRLKDPRLVKKSKSQQNQYKQLGHLLLECALLKNQQQVAQMDKTQKNLTVQLKNYSTKFIANVWILLNCSEQLCKKIDLSQKQVSLRSYKKVIQQIQNIKSTIQLQQKKQSIKTVTEKKTIVIPPLNLNLKFNKIKKPQLKVQLSSKLRNRDQNQNENEKQVSTSTTIKTVGKLNKQVVQKIFNVKNQIIKKVGGSQLSQFKSKKAQYVQNLQNSLKKKGKTVDKKLKFQQRSN